MQIVAYLCSKGDETETSSFPIHLGGYPNGLNVSIGGEEFNKVSLRGLVGYVTDIDLSSFLVSARPSLSLRRVRDFDHQF